MTEQLALELADPPRKERRGALRSFHTRRQPVKVDEALAGEKKARDQERAVLAVFRDAQGARLTPSAVWNALANRQPERWLPLLTSVRRAITNLTTQGLLAHHKTDRRPGPFGAKESTWSLAPQPVGTSK